MFSDNEIASAYVSEVHHKRFIDTTIKREDGDNREFARKYADAAMISGVRNATIAPSQD